MKKSLLVISMMLALAIVVGCYATKGDLEDVQAREMAMEAKVDQAAQDAQAAKAAAYEAMLKAEEAEKRAEEAEKRAEEAEKRTEEYELLYQKSMKK